MNLQNTILPKTKSDRSKVQVQGIELLRLPQYVICAGLGLVVGAVGVAVAIGAAILIQLMQPPSVIFSPGVIPLTLVAVLVGLGTAWLIGQVGPRLLPSLFESSDEQGLQLVLIFSALASLLQTYMFTRGL